MRVLNARERFLNCLTFRKVDRIPFMPGAPDVDALNRWYSEGLPSKVAVDEYFGWETNAVSLGGMHSFNIVDYGPIPRFFPPPGSAHRETRGTDKPSWVLSEDVRTRTVIDEAGITQRIMKGALRGMPQYLDFP